jgi:hypothetical protein
MENRTTVDLLTLSDKQVKQLIITYNITSMGGTNKKTGKHDGTFPGLNGDASIEQ